jgi:hypothetical protein
MTPEQVRKVIASLIAEGELPPKEPERLMAELYLHNGLTQRAIGELTGWNTTSVNQRITGWLEGMRGKLVSYDTMHAHSGHGCYSYYYVNPTSFPRPSSPMPLSPEQAQRAAAIKQGREAVRHPQRRVLSKRAISERLRYAAELLAVWPG